MIKPVVLVICFSDLQRDPRVYRQILALQEKFKVIAAGYSDPRLPDVTFIKCTNIADSLPGKILTLGYLKLGWFERYYWSKALFNQAYQNLLPLEYDLILANDCDALPLSVRLAGEKQVKLIYDAHEYSPREFENSWKWRFLWQKYRTYQCKKYLPLVDAMISVCDGITKEYARNFNVKASIITNAPLYQNLTPSIVNEERIKIIHHGAAIPARKIELMIELVQYLDKRFSLDLMLLGDVGYIDQLKALAKSDSRIRFIAPVDMPKIANTINQYDIGIYLLKDESFNEKHSLPNKFFEFIQGRLMIAVGPSFEMAKYVQKYNLGIVAADFLPQTLAQELNKLNGAQIQHYKAQSHANAHELSFERNKVRLINLVNQVLKEIVCE